MRTQVRTGNDGAQIYEEWRQTNHGWKLLQRDLR
jgi:hypothetical protein